MMVEQKRPLTRQQFIQRLRRLGLSRYQDKHPFTEILNEGKLTKTQLQAYILNWYYFEKMIPQKDAGIISNCPIPEVRRIWVSRILRHDGYGDIEGATEGWLKLCQAAGIDRNTVMRARFLPGVRLAIDSYVQYAKSKTWLEGIATSLTQVFLPRLVERRVNAFVKHYEEYVSPKGLEYFMSLQNAAREGSKMALDLVLRYAATREAQDMVTNAVLYMDDVLWSILDAIYSAYVVRKMSLSASI